MSSEPLDAMDERILDAVRGMHEATDPVPADLGVRVKFALRLAGPEFAVFRRQPELAGARDGAVRTLSFESADLTVLVTVSDRDDGTVQVDGFLAPAAPLRVGLRVLDGPELSATADADGRFGFASVPGRLGQLVVDTTGGGRLVTGAVPLAG